MYNIIEVWTTWRPPEAVVEAVFEKLSYYTVWGIKSSKIKSVLKVY